MLGAPERPAGFYYAPLHIAQSLSILRAECSVSGVTFRDVQAGEYYLYRNALESLITQGFDELFETRISGPLFADEVRGLLERFAFHARLGIHSRLESDWRPNESVVDHLSKLYVGLLQKNCSQTLVNEASQVFIHCPGIDLYGPLTLASVVREIDDDVPIILLGDYTYEPSIPALRALLSMRDMHGDDISSLVAMDPSYRQIRSALIRMVDVMIEGEGFDVLRRWYGATPQAETSVSGPASDSATYVSDSTGSVRQSIPDFSLAQSPPESSNGAILSLIRSNRTHPNFHPIPDYSDMLSGYVRGQFEFSRGCTYSCAFCERTTNWEKKVMCKDPARAVEEIKFLLQKHPGWKWSCWDAALDIAVDESYEFLKLVKAEGLYFDWKTALRLRPLPKDYLDLMAGTGCTRISFGFESADLDVLKSMYKSNNEAIVANRILEQCSSLPFELVGLYHMLGWPTDSFAAQKKTWDFFEAWSKRLPNLTVPSGLYIPGPSQGLKHALYEKWGIRLVPVSPRTVAEATIMSLDIGRFGALHYENGMSREDLVTVSDWYRELPYVTGVPGVVRQTGE